MISRGQIFLHLCFLLLFMVFDGGLVGASAESAAPLPPGHCITRLDHGTINWSTGTVSARGRVVPSDRKKADSPDFILSVAKSNARRNLIQTFMQMEICAGRQVEDVAAKNDLLLSGIEKIAFEALITDQQYTSDKTMEVVLETSMFGGFLQLILPDEIKQIPTIQVVDPPRPAEEESLLHTGLVIDATAIKFQPVIYPVIVSELGSEVYSGLFVSREFAVQQGVCRYLYDTNFDEMQDRVGNNPIRVKGLRKGNSGNSSIIISRSDAQMIEKTPERHQFLRRCRVVILVSPPQVSPQPPPQSASPEG